jgi:hypothetical protein
MFCLAGRDPFVPMPSCTPVMAKYWALATANQLKAANAALVERIITNECDEKREW